MKLPKSETVLRTASVFALVGLALMVWSVLDPRPPPVLVALSIGQAVGTLSFVLYIAVVVRELQRKRPQSERSASENSSAPPAE